MKPCSAYRTKRIAAMAHFRMLWEKIDWSGRAGSLSQRPNGRGFAQNWAWPQKNFVCALCTRYRTPLQEILHGIQPWCLSPPPKWCHTHLRQIWEACRCRCWTMNVDSGSFSIRQYEIYLQQYGSCCSDKRKNKIQRSLGCELKQPASCSRKINIEMFTWLYWKWLVALKVRYT